MARSRFVIAWALCTAIVCLALPHRAVFCGEDEAALAKEAEAIVAEIELLKKDLEKSKSAKGTVSKVDGALAKKKPDTTVRTESGKLQIGGLVQTWYVQYQRDSRGLFDDRRNAILDSNDANDNSTFEVRRAQLNFTLKPNAYVTAYVMIDPAAEANSYPLVTDNQAIGGSIFKMNNNVNQQFDTSPMGGSLGLGNFQTIQNLQLGFGVPNRILQDAYINYHNSATAPGDFDWHHDFQVGMFKPAFGEEGLRSDAQLDFVERSFLGILGNVRDLGAEIHGTWFNDRFQYWGGVFDGAQNYFKSNSFDGIYGGAVNRSDTNDAKDFSFRVLARPLASDCWGDLEVGYSTEFGYHGEGRIGDPINGTPTNGLEQGRSWSMRQDAWGYYAPGDCFRGLWTRGEWAWYKDRNEAGTVIDFTGHGGTSYINVGDNTGLAQSNGRAFSVQGWYVAAGYRFDKSVWFEKGGMLEKSKKLGKFIKPVELAFRYQSFQNVMTADLIDPTKTDVFSTRVYTGGINYYIQDHNAKIQVNYNAVINPDSQAAGGQRNFHEVRNNSFVISFQVAF